MYAEADELDMPINLRRVRYSISSVLGANIRHERPKGTQPWTQATLVASTHSAQKYSIPKITIK
jgi:hypothetical protein